MSIFAMNEVISMSSLRPTLKLVLLMLANAYNQETGKCHPSQERLAKECEVSIQTIQRHVAELENRGLIRRHTKHLGRGQGSFTHYQLRFMTESRNSKLIPVSDKKRNHSQTNLRVKTGEVRHNEFDGKTAHSRRIDLSCTMAGNKDNQKHKTETPALTSIESQLRDVELLAKSLLSKIENQIIRRTRGAEERRIALRNLTAEITWADQETLYVSWARPLDRAKTDLYRELRQAGVSLQLDHRREQNAPP